MTKLKRKNVFVDTYEREFQGIKRSKKGDDYALCVPCNDEICLTSIGKAAIAAHQATNKHKRAASAANRTQGIRGFFSSSSIPTNVDRQIAAAEGAWAYHIAKHAQSFRSSDCISSDGFFKTIFSDSEIAKRFSSAHSKTAAIIKGVLAPNSVKTLLEELSDHPYSISTDASNFKTTKLFPLVIRYFTAKAGICVRLLDLESLGGETAAQIYAFITKSTNKHGLKLEKLIAFCADNTTTNFGGSEHRGENNVFFKLKSHRNNLIPIGCPTHVLHNAAIWGADNLPVDIEAIVFKLASHFKNSTKRIERLKEICDYIEANFVALNSHGPTRWTTLQGVVDKIIRSWDVLVEYFATGYVGPLILRQFFKSESSKPIIFFLSQVLYIFNESIDALQRDRAILPELIEEMEKFKGKIRERYERKFYGIMTGQLLRRLSVDEAENLRANFQEFYRTTLNYVDKWFRVERFPTCLDWISLKTREVSHEEVIELASQLTPEIKDSLFDEITDLNRILSEVSAKDFDTMSSEDKWKRIFTAKLPNLYALVSLVLSIPVSNAFVERIFSLCSLQWTDKRNLLNVESVKGLVQVKVNYELTCPEMYKMIISNPKLIKDIIGNEKYL